MTIPRLAGLVTIAVSLLAAPAAAQESPLLQAMRDEVTRAMTGLRIAGQPAPYFIACSIDDIAGRQIVSTMGADVVDGRQRSRTLRVDVRVGDYARDSSRFVALDRDPGVSSMFASGVVQVPLDDDVTVVRRQLWLTIDAAYRRALATFAKKQAALQNQAAPDPIPDWSRETPRTTKLPGLPPATSADAWVGHARQISAALARPELTRSDVTIGVTQGTRYAITSEGFTTVTPIQAAHVRLTAETQADDGMPLRDSVAMHARTVAALPAPADLAAQAKELAAGLVALRTAPVGEDFTGPVLVEGRAAPELLAQTLVPLFLTQRPPELDNPQMMASLTRGLTAPFLTRVGSRVLPEGFSVSDTPSVATHEGREVPGAYTVDDEGIPAQDVTLAEKGILKTLLTSRTPQKGFVTSNGHGRSGTAQAGVFQMQSSTAVASAALKQKYLERLKADGRAFGYVLRALGPAGPGGDPEDMFAMAMMRGPGGPSGPAIVRAYRIAADGTETLVRGLQLGQVTHTAYRDLVEASSERTLYNYRASVPQALQMATLIQGGQPPGDVLVSLIAPNLIFGELEIEKPDRPFQKPPIVASPLR
jgi:TldD protein